MVTQCMPACRRLHTPATTSMSLSTAPARTTWPVASVMFGVVGYVTRILQGIKIDTQSRIETAELERETYVDSEVGLPCFSLLPVSAEEAALPSLSVSALFPGTSLPFPLLFFRARSLLECAALPFLSRQACTWLAAAAMKNTAARPNTKGVTGSCGRLGAAMSVAIKTVSAGWWW